MIAKENRFHGRNALNVVYRHGQAVRGEYISLRYAQSRREDYRLAVVVSKKVSKSAVVRNRIRRRVYEIVRLYMQEQAQPHQFDLVISVFDDKVAVVSHDDLRTKVIALLTKVVLSK